MRRLSYDGAVRRGREGLTEHVTGLASEGQRFAVQRHDSAPRGGVNLNMFGDRRSAPGEQPAPETGNLGRLLERPPVVQGANTKHVSATIIVNYAALENYNAGARIAPRPIGVPLRLKMLGGGEA